MPETPYDWASAAVTAATGGGEAGATKIVEHATPGRHGIPLGGASAPSVAAAGKFLARANFVTGAAATVYGGVNDYQNGKTSGSQAITQTVGSLGGGIAGGALAGAAVGSFAGPVGTAVGAGIGAVIGSEVGKSLGKMVGGWFE
ncbi:hypothetical protein [Tsukamurella sp. NPDC003166]|uniref:hypothetical protein n=1 Tax=Tsukamurella sp. NPDC003166 TaxID=3154444 RepID=UPI0033A9EDEC